MTRRKKGLQARHLPAAFERYLGEPFDEDQHDLWWVRPPMVRVAVQAVQDMPADGIYDDHTVTTHWPAPMGVLVWEGGCGLATPHGDDGKWHEIVGVFWGLAGPGERNPYACVPLMLADGELALPPYTWVEGSKPAMDFIRRLETLLITTWLLAEQPTLGRKSFLTRTGADTQQIDWRTLLPKPELPRSITVATLREIAKTPEKWDHEEGEAKWKLTKRHYVRGHWRQQAAGPGRTLRRPVYVPPYVKGPDGAPMLDQTPLVHIWRR